MRIICFGPHPGFFFYSFPTFDFLFDQGEPRTSRALKCNAQMGIFFYYSGPEIIDFIVNLHYSIYVDALRINRLTAVTLKIKSGEFSS